MRKDKLNTPTPIPRPRAGLSISSLRSISHSAPLPLFRSKQTGFTYIALLIGVAIIGATLAAVAQVTQTIVQREREQELLFIGNQFLQAINRFYASNRSYPMQLEDLVLDNHSPGIKRHLRKIYVDPMTGLAEWGMVKLGDGQIVGVYSLSEAEPLKKAGFRLTEAGLENKDKYSEWIFMAALRGAANVPANVVPANPLPPNPARSNPGRSNTPRSNWIRTAQR